MSYKICTYCNIHHYEDCRTCFGFDLHDDGTIVTAAEAHDENYTDTIPCPECLSTVKGLPMNACQHCGADLDTTPGSLVWGHSAAYCPACQTMTFGDISIKKDGTREASKERILTAANGDIVKSVDTIDWVFWPGNGGYYTAFSLRVIADELDKRNKKLFA